MLQIGFVISAVNLPISGATLSTTAVRVYTDFLAGTPLETAHFFLDDPVAATLQPGDWIKFSTGHVKAAQLILANRDPGVLNFVAPTDLNVVHGQLMELAVKTGAAHKVLDRLSAAIRDILRCTKVPTLPTELITELARRCGFSNQQWLDFCNELSQQEKGQS